jgi:hypothetical protein
MATRFLTNWRVVRIVATSKHGSSAKVWLYGKEYLGLLKRYRPVSETYHIPLEQNTPTDDKADQALVKKAIAMSPNDWKESVA